MYMCSHIQIHRYTYIHNIIICIFPYNYRYVHYRSTYKRIYMYIYRYIYIYMYLYTAIHIFTTIYSCIDRHTENFHDSVG